MQTARTEYERIVAKERVRRGLNKQVTPAADRIYVARDQVYVYRERMKRWSGPLFVERSDGKDISIHVGRLGVPRSFNLSAVKPALIYCKRNPDTVL
jgi:hypothetical protein